MFKVTLVKTMCGKVKSEDHGVWDTKRDAEQFGAYIINDEKHWFEEFGDYVFVVADGKHFMLDKGEWSEMHVYIEVKEVYDETD